MFIIFTKKAVKKSMYVSGSTNETVKGKNEGEKNNVTCF